MQKQSQPNANGEKIPQKKDSHQQTIKEKVRKHISDITDVITDEDIRDAQPDTRDYAEDIREKEELLKEGTDLTQPLKKGKGTADSKSGSSWDVIGE